MLDLVELSLSLGGNLHLQTQTKVSPKRMNYIYVHINQFSFEPIFCEMFLL